MSEKTLVSPPRNPGALINLYLLPKDQGVWAVRSVPPANRVELPLGVAENKEALLQFLDALQVVGIPHVRAGYVDEAARFRLHSIKQLRAKLVRGRQVS